MKILVSASACNPNLGSENYFGWSAVLCLAQDHELWVLTSPRNRPDLEQAQAAGQVGDNVHFVYAGRFKPWHSHPMLGHLQAWKEYMDFSKDVPSVAQRLHQQMPFDLAHHLTLSTWRLPSPLWKLGIPFVFGPVGGNELFPWRLLSILSPMGAAFELARKASNIFSQFSPGVRFCIRRAAHVFAANAETEALIARLRGSTNGISRLLAYFHSTAGAKAAAECSKKKALDGPLRLFAGGALDGRKGVALALQALARVKSRGVRFHYRYGGKGPEFDYIQRLVTRLGLQNEVVVGEALSGEDYQNELNGAHIYLLPSLRDSAGITLAEAMLAGCVPIVADCGGPGQIVSSDCGYKVPPSSAGRLIDEISKIIVSLDQNRAVLQEKGAAAAKRIAQNFTEENYRETVNSVYERIRQKGNHRAGEAG